jgi:hypothetical protein
MLPLVVDDEYAMVDDEYAMIVMLSTDSEVAENIQE